MLKGLTLGIALLSLGAAAGCDDDSELEPGADAGGAGGSAGASGSHAAADAGDAGKQPSVDAGPPDAGPSDAGLFGDATEVELAHVFLASDWDADGGVPPEVTPEIDFALRQGRGHLAYVDRFGCSDPYDALVVREGNEASVLFRLRTEPNACGSAVYRMRLAIENADSDTRVTVYRQDAVSGPIERIGSAVAGSSDADCDGLVECSSAEPCAYEGPVSETVSPVDGPEDVHGCATVDACGKAVCVDHREACMMSCGQPDCAILESHPVQVRCEG